MRTKDGYIIHKCLNGDSDAFGLLVDKYKTGVYALAYSRLGNFHDAQDVAQDVFIKAYENLHTLRRWERFSAWLYRITTRRCLNLMRSRSKRPDYEFFADGKPGSLEQNSLDTYHQERAFGSVHEAIESLPEDHRQVLTLHYMGGMTSFEIARFVGMAPATIRRKLIKARELLKMEMLDIAFEAQKLPAAFTSRILDIVKHIRVRPLPRLAELPWGVAVSLGILAVILSLGIFAGVHEAANRDLELMTSEVVGSTGLSEIFVDIIDQKIYDREGDTSMLNNGKISTISILTVVLGILSGNAMAQQTVFSDDFEDQDVSDWRVEYYGGDTNASGVVYSEPGTPIFEATADAAKSGNYGLRFTRDQQIGNSVAANSPAFGPLDGKIQVDIDFIPDNYNHVFWLSELAPFEAGSNTQIAQCGISIDQGEIYTRAAGYPFLGYYDPDKFYHLTIIADVSANTFDVEMTGDLRDPGGNSVGVLSATGLAFERGATSISRITLYTGSDASLQPTVGVDNVTVKEYIENRPPVANAGAPHIKPATSWDGAWVTLDGSASYDPDGDPITYSWKIGEEEIGTNETLYYQFPIDITTVSLAVSDEELDDTITTTVTVSIIDVLIDIKPGSDPNSINLGSHGVVPVAFLTTPDFDAADIEPDTVTLRGEDFSGLLKLRGKKQEPMANLEDVDGDGDLDLVVHLLTENLTLDPESVVCVLGALTYDGFVVQGEDSVNIVPEN